MNQSTIYVILITLGVGLCGLYGARFSQSQSQEMQISLQKNVFEKWVKSADKNSGKDKKLQALWQKNLASSQEASQAISVVHPQIRLSAWTQEYIGMFGFGILCILIGSLGARSVKRKHLTQDNSSSSDHSSQATDFGVLLQSIATHIQDLYQTMHSELTQDNDTLNDQWLKDIEQLQKNQMDRIIRVKDRFQIQYGMDAFTAVFGSFSQAERRLNRAWSALVDQHVAEAFNCVENANISIQEAVTHYEKYTPKNS